LKANNITYELRLNLVILWCLKLIFWYTKIMIEVLQNIKFIFFISVFFLMFSLEYYFPKRKWETHRIKRLGFHGLLSIFNTVVMYIPRIFLIIPALMIVNENNLGLLNIIDQSFIVEALIALLI